MALVVSGGNDGSAQSRRAVSVSVGYAASVDELRRWDAIVDGMRRTGDLVVTARRADRWLPDRTHEYLAQHVTGVPVYGAGVMRQLERGVTVSLLGTIQRGLDVAAGPFLPAVEVVARIELATGASLATAQSPQLVVLPLPAGTAVPTYRLLADDARVYFAAAADGALVRAVDAFDQQAPPGAGRAGDIVTLDLRFDGQRSAALLEPGPFRTPRWAASDVAAHAHVDLHTARTYDYFGRRFGWFGPDGVHGRIVSLVNAGIHGARAYRPPYGPDGAGAYVYGLAEGGSGVALHTVAHELMHGVAHFTVGRRTGTVAGLVTDFATSVRLGPREFTDDDGRIHSCETASFPIQIEGEWQSLPAWCQNGRFLLASAQGAGVNEAFADIFSTAVQFFHEQAGVPAGYVVGGGSDQSFASRRSLADPGSLGDPDAYSARLELALAVDDRRWHYSGFAFEEGRFAGSTRGCCYGGEHWNSTILSHAFYLAVEGGANRTTGLRVTGAGEPRRAQMCTFDARKHVTEAEGGNAQSLSLNYVADIVRHPDIPDRDLYVFDTATDRLVEVVDSLGTLLYGIAADSQGRVFIAQTEARNDANGKAGTEQHGLAELENRAFLNRITRVPCNGGCGEPTLFELEPLPPDHPAPGMELATPFAIAVSDDDATLVVTAAASSRIFTVDAGTGAVLGRADVGSIPRGLALETSESGAPARAWVLNALANSVSLVDLADPAAPRVEDTIALFDPTDPELKQGRIAINSAHASSTGTFACASCHPDGHTDQLLWVLDTPLCDVGCDQIQPRLAQDIRGLRGSAPYHWDGVFGDPYGGVNTASIRTPVEPNCDVDVPESCTVHVLEGALRATMCDQADCETNDEGKPGLLSGAERAAMAKYLLSVPYPPSPDRPYTNTLTSVAMEGVRRFHFTKQCGNCHRLPFWTMTNMGGSGMDVPSWRGANDRWKNAPQNRFFFADLVRGDTRGFPERTGFTNDSNLFQMIVEGSIGFSGALGRQITLNPETAGSEETADLLDALEQSAAEGGVVLQAEGVRLHEAGAATTLALQYDGTAYRGRDDGDTSYSRRELTGLAAEGDLLLTITARLGRLADYDHPQPTLRPHELPILPMFPGGRPADFPELHSAGSMRLRGEHIQEGAYVLVDGRRVAGAVACEEGTLPDCVDDTVIVELDRLPAEAGLHLLQVQNPQGLFSNDLPFHVLDAPARATSGNLISSGGTFDGQGAWRANLTNASVTWEGEADFAIDAPSSQPWRVQLSHHVAIREGVEYSLCYSAKGDDLRYIQVNVDTGPDDYRSLMGSGSTPEVGAETRGAGASLTRQYHRFRHRFISPEADGWARITFTLAQSDVDVQIDDVGLYEGRGCGTP